MKRRFLSVLTLSILALNVNAQDEAGSASASSDEKLNKLRFGVFVAPTMSWMRPSAAKDGDQTQKSGGSKIGFMYGLMGDYNFTSNYAIALGLQVNSTGGKIETENPKADYLWANKTSVDYTLQYLEVPLALKLKTDRMGKICFFGQAGLTIGFNISKKFTYEIVQERNAMADTTYSTGEKEKITGKITSIAPIVFQMNVGGGMQYSIGPKLDAYVGLFFNNGFAPNITDPTKFDNLPQFKDGNTRLNNFAIRLGFYF